MLVSVVASPRHHDPAALGRAVTDVGGDVLTDVRTPIGNLPLGWSGRDERPLIEQRHSWDACTLEAEIGRVLDLRHWRPKESRAEH